MATSSPIVEGVDRHEPFPTYEFRGSRLFFAFVLLAAGSVAAGVAALGSLVLASIGVAYAGWAGYRLISPGRLCVTGDGIVDETFWYSPGLIPWPEVTDIRPTRWGLVEIDLVDDNVFLERLGPLSRVALFKQQLYGFGPALIVPWVLRGGRSTIVDRLQEGLDAHTLLAFSESLRSDPMVDGPPDDQRDRGGLHG